MKRIEFYRASAEHGEFSNFARFSVEIDGRTWPTTEHYFQAQKFTGNPREEEIRLAASPMIAASMGRSRQFRLRSDWEEVKEQIMYRAVLAKFTQHADLRSRLLATGDVEIVEHSGKDAYWGDGGDGSGKNVLGKILMQVRHELRQNDFRRE